MPLFISFKLTSKFSFSAICKSPCLGSHMALLTTFLIFNISHTANLAVPGLQLTDSDKCTTSMTTVCNVRLQELPGKVDTRFSVYQLPFSSAFFLVSWLQSAAAWLLPVCVSNPGYVPYRAYLTRNIPGFVLKPSRNQLP